MALWDVFVELDICIDLVRWEVGGGEEEYGGERVLCLGEFACRVLELPFVCCSRSIGAFRFRDRLNAWCSAGEPLRGTR